MHKNCKTCNCELTLENASRKDETRFRVQCKACYNKSRSERKENKKSIKLEEEINNYLNEVLSPEEYNRRSKILVDKIESSDLTIQEKVRLNDVLVEDLFKKINDSIDRVSNNITKINQYIEERTNPGFLARIWSNLKKLF